MIYSYETLINNWILEKNSKSISMLGKYIRGDMDGFLYRYADELLKKAIKTGDVTVFMALMCCYSSDDISEFDFSDIPETFVELIELYKEHAIDKINQKMLHQLTVEHKSYLL